MEPGGSVPKSSTAPQAALFFEKRQPIDGLGNAESVRRLVTALAKRAPDAVFSSPCESNYFMRYLLHAHSACGKHFKSLLALVPLEVTVFCVAGV